MIPLSRIAEKTLEETVRDCGADQKIARSTEKLVFAHLFSRYEGKRAAALKILCQYWDHEIEVTKLEDSEMMYTYMRFEGHREYILVGRYSTNMTIDELEPTAIERDSWIV